MVKLDKNDNYYMEGLLKADELIMKAFPDIKRYSEAWTGCMHIMYHKLTLNRRFSAKETEPAELSERKASLKEKLG